MKNKRMKWRRCAIAAAVIGIQTVTNNHLLADDPPDTINNLKQQIEQLDKKLRILERNRELETEASEAKAKEAPKISIGEKGFSFGSADGNFVISLKGVLQTDSRTFFKDGGIRGNDGLLLRRARPILEGTVFRDFDFLFVPDFGGSTVQIFDAYFNYRYKPELQLQVGKFKSPVGLEQLQADANLLFNERTLATDLVPNRDIGAELHGDLFGGRLSYAAGIFNGIGNARNSGNADFEDDKDFEGRIIIQPLKTSNLAVLQGLGFGVGGSYGSTRTASALPSTTGGTLPGYTTDGQQQFFAYNPTGPTNTPVVVANGTHWRLSPQAYYYYGPFGLFGEYVISSQELRRTVVAPLVQDKLDDKAWEITGSWVLTGEDASYKGVVPAKPFDPSAGHWGAVQLVGRYAKLEIDPDTFPLFADATTSARSASAWSVGLNWFLNRNVKVMASFSRTTFSGGGGAGTTAPAIVTRRPENVLFTRLQLAF